MTNPLTPYPTRRAAGGGASEMEIEVGSVWLEKATGRRIRILEEFVHDTGPAWTYIDAAGNPEPHGLERANGHTYPDWYWHYCDVLDFVVWGRFAKET